MRAMMSQESIPPSDDDIFISTQIQGKLDDIEEETRAKGITSFLQQFANRTPDPVINVQKLNEAAKLKARPKSKPKRKAKKLSVTDQMIRKLSGKPQKLRQMHLKDNIGIGDINLRTSSFGKEHEESYESVFTSNEWKRMKYVFNVGDHYKVTGNENFDKSGKSDDLWNAASVCPELNIESWSGLYGYQDNCNVKSIESESMPPITFSQAYYSSQNTIEDYKFGGCEEDVNTEVQESDAGAEILENVFDLETTFGDEVVCSSDEGSVIELPKNHRGTDESPILLSTQDSDSTDIYSNPQSGGVKYKGCFKISEESVHRIRTRIPSEEGIPNSSDDDGDLLNYIQIIRHEKGLVNASSRGFGTDEDK